MSPTHVSPNESSNLSVMLQVPVLIATNNETPMPVSHQEQLLSVTKQSSIHLPLQPFDAWSFPLPLFATVSSLTATVIVISSVSQETY